MNNGGSETQFEKNGLNYTSNAMIVSLYMSAPRSSDPDLGQKDDSVGE